MRLIDSHCHLNADRFEADADLVIGAARLAGVERILVPGWNVASSERALELRGPIPVARRRRRDPPARRGEGGRWGLGADHGLGPGPPGRGHRRDRARLRPGLQPDRRPADEPAPEPRRSRSRRASRRSSTAAPPRAGATPRTRSSENFARRASAVRRGPPHSERGRRRSSTRSRVRSTTPAR